jgi:stage V sporulation protein D (sporulation-specific penicillin-binding protein)
MEKKNLRNWRSSLILFFILLFGAALIGRLFFLSVVNHKFYQALALGQQAGFTDVVGSRGQIFCVNSQSTKGVQSSVETKNLATNRDSWTISADLSEIQDRQSFAQTLKGYIGMTKDEILSKMENQDSYAIIKRAILPDELEKIKKLNLKGLQWQNSPSRFYPQGKLASQVVGFLGGEGSGQYGIEGYYDDILKGKLGIKETKKGLDSLFSNDDVISLDGSDIYLTIDYNIQFEAEALLEAEKAKDDIESGQIIVMKPDSGKILALANFPSFDPNQYSKENLGIFQNGVVQKLFEPGSIMKPFTMAAALNEGKITPDTTYVDTGVLQFGKYSIHNFANEVYGKQTMTQVLESSINTGAVYAQQQVSHKTFFDYVDKFGFTKKTGIDLQGEVYSRNDILKNGHDIEFATASFGQGIELTPLQIARGFCALANGGKIVKPYIVDRIIAGADESVTKPEVSGQVVSQQTISQLTSMLVNVVDKGFNSVAKVQGYYLAGKTGTAQVPIPNGKGYDLDKTIQSFVGFGPALNPQFLIMVKLDNPKVPKSSLSAVPVFKKLAQYIINYWQIPPDYDASKAK